jgi:hypothetical protein
MSKSTDWLVQCNASPITRGKLSFPDVSDGTRLGASNPYSLTNYKTISVFRQDGTGIYRKTYVKDRKKLKWKKSVMDDRYLNDD